MNAALVEKKFPLVNFDYCPSNPRMLLLNILQFYLLPLIPQRIHRLANALNLHINYVL